MGAAFQAVQPFEHGECWPEHISARRRHQPCDACKFQSGKRGCFQPEHPHHYHGTTSFFRRMTNGLMERSDLLLSISRRRLEGRYSVHPNDSVDKRPLCPMSFWEAL